MTRRITGAGYMTSVEERIVVRSISSPVSPVVKPSPDESSYDGQECSNCSNPPVYEVLDYSGKQSGRITYEIAEAE